MDTFSFFFYFEQSELGSVVMILLNNVAFEKGNLTVVKSILNIHSISFWLFHLKTYIHLYFQVEMDITTA